MTQDRRSALYTMAAGFVGFFGGLFSCPTKQEETLESHEATLFNRVPDGQGGHKWMQIPWRDVKPGMEIICIDIHKGQLYRLERWTTTPPGHMCNKGINAVTIDQTRDFDMLAAFTDLPDKPKTPVVLMHDGEKLRWMETSTC